MIAPRRLSSAKPKTSLSYAEFLPSSVPALPDTRRGDLSHDYTE
jgi:hypothetical protein